MPPPTPVLEGRPALNIHLVLLLAYSVVLISLGAWIGRLVRSTDAFFVAGRRLGPVLLFSTLLAANIGAGSTISKSAHSQMTLR